MPAGRLPEATAEYSKEQMDRLIRLLQQVQEDAARKDVTFSKVQITDLPTSATGLKAGELWNSSNTVKVV